MAAAERSQLAKSLHTVTVLIRVAQHLLAASDIDGPENAVQEAARILGYEGAPDPYGLVAKATAQMCQAHS